MINPVPPLAPLEREALTKSIMEYGVLVPVIRSAGPACEGEIVDGFHRTEIAMELGIEPPVVTQPFETEEDFRIAQIETNLQRRQLNTAQKIELGMALEPLEKARAKRRMGPGAKGEGAVRDVVGKSIGLSGATYERGKKILEEGSQDLTDGLRSGRYSVNEAWRKLKQEQKAAEKEATKKKAKTLAPPKKGPYDVILCDPPWPTMDAPYPTMTMEQIADLPVAKLAKRNATLWLWCLNSNLHEAHELVFGWGFNLGTVVTWAKNTPGPGIWLRGQTEHCLVAYRGKPQWDLRDESTLIIANRRKHSQKPDKMYELIEQVAPGTKLEMFARNEREGWASWGAEL